MRIARRGARLDTLDQGRATAALRDLGDCFDEEDLPEGELEDLETELFDEASAARTIAELEQQGISVERMRIEARAHLRYAGTDTTIPVLAYHLLRRIKDSIVAARSKPMPDGRGVSINTADLHLPNPDGHALTEWTEIEDWLKPELMKAEFERTHQARFGFIDETKEIVFEAVSVEAIYDGDKPQIVYDPVTPAPTGTAAPPGHQR